VLYGTNFLQKTPPLICYFTSYTLPPTHLVLDAPNYASISMIKSPPLVRISSYLKANPHSATPFSLTGTLPRASEIDIGIARLKYHARLSQSLVSINSMSLTLPPPRLQKQNPGTRNPWQERGRRAMFRSDTGKITSDERTRWYELSRGGFREN
jgi:hypothetical protein